MSPKSQHLKANIYLNAPEFLDRALPFLEAEEVANSLILGLSLRLRSRGEKQQNLFATVERKDKVILGALMTPPYNVVLSQCVELDAVDRIARLLHSHDMPVPGVIGPSEAAKRFVEAWHRMFGTEYHLQMYERLYKLESVMPTTPPQGFFRPAEEYDADQLAEWVMAFNQEALQDKTNIDDARATVLNRLTFKELYVWDDNGPVTMAARARPTRHTQSIGLVYTPPEKRGRGYASSCVASLSQEILDMGYRSAVLFTDLSNPVSNSIYQKIGYRPVCDYDEYKFL